MKYWEIRYKIRNIRIIVKIRRMYVALKNLRYKFFPCHQYNLFRRYEFIKWLDRYWLFKIICLYRKYKWKYMKKDYMITWIRFKDWTEDKYKQEMNFNLWILYSVKVKFKYDLNRIYTQ